MTSDLRVLSCLFWCWCLPCLACATRLVLILADRGKAKSIGIAARFWQRQPLRRPQVAVGRTLAVAFTLSSKLKKIRRIRNAQESCGCTASPTMSSGALDRDASALIRCSCAAEAVFHVDEQGSCCRSSDERSFDHESAFHSQFGSVHPCCSPKESAACFIHAADSSVVQKILPPSEKCERPFASFAYLFGWDISASEWDLQGHRLHLSSQCSDRQIFCHTIATAIASSSLATYVSAVSELWSSEQICYRSD